MSHLRPLVAATLAITLSCAAYAEPARAGGGRGGGGGGGGAPHSGGADMRASGGDMRGSDGPDFGADAPHSSSGRHFAGDGGRQFSGRPAAPHFAGRAHDGDRARLSTIGGNAN